MEMKTELDECAGNMCLPEKESLSPFLRNLLNQNFNSVDDLSATPSLLARLQSELETDNGEFCKVQARVLVATAQGVSYYGNLTDFLHKLASVIENVRVSAMPPSSSEKHFSADAKSGVNATDSFSSAEEGAATWEELESSEIESIMNQKIAENCCENELFDQRAMVEELEALASEVARVERVRIYAESVLKLEQLVGDLEASVAMISGYTSKVGSAATSLRITRAVRRMQSTESAVAEIAHTRWIYLVSAVDLRVDRVAAILRPAAIADHRGLLTSIGWPPPLSAVSAGERNPFLEMSEDQERKYCESFMALAILQAVQQGRRERQYNHYDIPLQERGEFLNSHENDLRRGRSRSPRAPLWAVEELILPLAAKAEPHFVRWTTKPELVFALVYRIAQVYVDVIDEFLQPLIDKANLAGYSAREEWVFSLVGVVSLYLQTHVLPGLANDLQDEGEIGSVGASLWLHIVDQALAFDSRMKSLAMRVAGLFQEGEGGQVPENLSGPVVLSISAVADRQDWLILWAKLELKDVLEKVRAELQMEVAWTLRNKSSSFLGLVDGGNHGFAVPVVARIGEFRAPPGADFVLSSMSTVTDRCRNLSEPDQQYRFMKDAVMPVAREYCQTLLRRCEELEAVTSLSEEGSMVTLSTCVNAARYCEQSLQDWGENVFFLELFQMQQDDAEEYSKEMDGSIFDEEIERFKRFREGWVDKLVSSICRGFEARCREYLRNKKRWTEVGKGIRGLEFDSKVTDVGYSERLSVRQSDLLDENYVNILKTFDVSASLLDALAVLQSQLRILGVALDNVNFFELWRNIATALDHLLFNSVVFSGAKFSEHGGWQFAADIQGLFLILKPYCVRPSGFFKTLHEAVRLLTLPSKDAVSVLDLFGSPPANFKDQSDFPAERNTVLIDSLKQFGVRKLPPSTAKRILLSRILPKF